MGIRIVITDDHPIVLEGLQKVLHKRDGFEITGTYTDGKSLLNGLEQHLPDILLLDVYLPDIKGTELAKLVSQKYPSIRIIALTSTEHIPDIKLMLRNGCSGYLLKNVSVDVLSQAIKTVFAGEEFVEPVIKERLIQSLMHPTSLSGTIKPQLTSREQKILEMIGSGKTSQDIAGTLFLSYRTIQNNRQSLYKKFDVHNTAELIRMAIQNGMLPG
jgi:DNA-binding NarL/FixJ family response regulator